MGKFKPGSKAPNSKKTEKQNFKKSEKQQQVDKLTQEEIKTQQNIKCQIQAQEEYEQKHKSSINSATNEAGEEEQKNNKEITEQQQQKVNFLQSDDVEDKRMVIVVLEGCMLEVAKIHKCEVLLNSDEHKAFISNKLNRDFSVYRPDVVHHSLLSLLDSPLNKAGLLRVYIHTEQNVLIEINPSTKIPRTYKRFASLMIQLLNKLRIRAVQSSETLLKVIKNPITDHLPPNCINIGTSCKGRLVNMTEYVQKLPKNGPICFAVGGVAKGNPGGETDYCEDIISCSQYSLSAGYAIGRLLGAFETEWSIL